ncbi:MAG: Gfo/Idh/MocA family oxidoreductase [Candidatus Micrarchaeota archaeon]|nr:Gfo/Idh/MocA family oxidoreductase [Candidatus Micrarchaeota archaeon]
MVYRAGIIGCGRIGSELDEDPKRKVTSSHAGAYSKTEATELVAVCDINADKREKCRKRWNVPAAYEDYKRMLSEESLDILSICTHADTHLEIVREAVKHKSIKAIFCEKPIANDLSSAREMVELCEKGGIILAIGHQRRFEKFHRNVKEYIESGALGKPQQAAFFYGAGIANTGSHVMDLLRYYFGDAEWVQADYSAAPSHNIKDPNIDALIRFKNGASASIHACDVKSYHIFELDMLFTRGRIRIKNAGFFGEELYRVGESPIFSGYLSLHEAPFPFPTDEPRQLMLDAVAHIVECIEKRQKPLCSGRDGLASLELICALHESAKRKGERVSLPLEASDFKIM